MNTHHIIKQDNYLMSARTFFKSLLDTGEIQAVLVPLRQSRKNDIMPALVTDSKDVEKADPFTPCFPINSAKLVSRISRKGLNKKTAVFMRPCEIRALMELVKLKQADMTNLVIISWDCLSAFPNKVFKTAFREKGEAFTNEYLASRLSSSFIDDYKGNIATACRICSDPFPSNADIIINPDPDDTGSIKIISESENGVSLLSLMKLKTEELPEKREEKREENKKKVRAELKKNRETVFKEVHELTSDFSKLNEYFSSCINCYNCRVACPVCYCRECVFNTDVFDYEPIQYMNKSLARGTLRMPTDTLFFHLTRMIHISLSCVGCGQCSNACPNEIPLAELFMSIAQKAQDGFAYVSGSSSEVLHPLSFFLEDEFNDVTGV
jgi:formate dehydrogenase (coenzyme F420) beta subunit